jgi:hypothetical protein
MVPGGPPVVHNNSCYAPGALHVPFQDTFSPRYPKVAPRYHICNSCHGENDPCASFYYKGWYHYFYRELILAPLLLLLLHVAVQSTDAPFVIVPAHALHVPDIVTAPQRSTTPAA